MRNKRFDQLLFVVLISLVVWYVVFLYTRKSDQPVIAGIENGSDTIQPVVTTASSSQTFPLIFDAAFINGTSVKQGNESHTFRRKELGTIKIESGKIIACDDINLSRMQPFTQQFPVGEFPVQLALINLGGYERVAFCRILFSADSISRWEFALRPGQDSIGLTDSLTPCYSVDAAMALFIDSAANTAFNSMGETAWNDAFMQPWVNESYTGYLHNFNGHNLATFSSGDGDGCYSAYIGYNIRNEPCCLLTDFDFVSWWNCR